MRVAITTRSRYTEDRLIDATRRGIGQRVLLGAGLDSFADRSSLGRQLRVFEVDHPDIGDLCPDTELVMEYIVPAALRDEAGQALADFFFPRAAALAEPWLTCLTPADVQRLLDRRRLTVLDDVGRRDQIEPWPWERADSLRPHQLGRVTRAVVSGTRLL